MSTTSLQQALELIDQLSLDEKATLREILGRRLVEQRRQEIAGNAGETARAVREGQASRGTVEDFRRELSSE